MQGMKFNQQGIEGILAGRKTVTRRPISSLPLSYLEWCELNQGSYNGVYAEWLLTNPRPKYKIGETVFVQEEFYKTVFEGKDLIIPVAGIDQLYLIGGMTLLPASEMTEQQSRIKLKITGVKVERLQDISEEDCIKEGAYCKKCDNGKIKFFRSTRACCPECGRRKEGDGLIGVWLFKDTVWQPLPYPPKYQWSANPYVFAYEFEVVS